MADEEKTEVQFHLVTPIGRAKMDGYNSTFVAPGDTMLMDAEAARTFVAMGEVEIVEKNVTPPWAVKPEAPAKEPKK